MSFLETPEPSRRMSEALVVQLWRTIVDSDRLATQKGVTVDMTWGMDGYGVRVSAVSVVLTNPYTVLLTIERPHKGTAMRSALVEEFKKARNLIQLL